MKISHMQITTVSEWVSDNKPQASSVFFKLKNI